jgi:hypothetical protein
MKQDNYLELLSVLMFLLILAAVFAVADQRDALKQEAVDRGFAEWVIKGENETEFKWKELIK